MGTWLRGTRIFGVVAVGGLVAAAFPACSSASGGSNVQGSGGTGATGASGGSGATGGWINDDSGGGGTGGGGLGRDPITCDEAAQVKSYIGCDFWPTVTTNGVWSVFDFAVVVANAGDQPADIEVRRAGNVVQTDNVPANGLKKIYLPWVTELKFTDADQCGSTQPIMASNYVNGGAYHLTTTRPVTVYQFNALEYRGQGGPAGKSWAGCPGDQVCPQYLQAVGCFSFSNDASLLLPSTAMTGNYRVTSQADIGVGTFIAITGIQDNTNVSVKVAPGANLLTGGGVIPPTNGGGTATFSIGRGAVAQLVAQGDGQDFSGSLVQADKPVQVIAGNRCMQAPKGAAACDHIEESVFPAETLGQRYFVVPPTAVNGNVVGHLVKIYGNVDGTTLSYPTGAPQNAPTTINAGQVVSLGRVQNAFEVVGDHEFAVGSFMLGGSIQDPNAGAGNEKGDPSQSLAIAVEQYRTKYVFLAPDDYDVSYVDIVMPDGANVTLDGSPMQTAPQAIGSGFGVARVTLGPGTGGAHLLQSDVPVGIQVMGYGAYTSYQYPGGLNLEVIAPPPVK